MTNDRSKDYSVWIEKRIPFLVTGAQFILVEFMDSIRFHAAIVRTGLALLLIAHIASCAGSYPARTVSVPVPKAKPSLNIQELEKQIHELINRERENKGLSPLSWNNTLSKIARKHSQDMAKRNYFSHGS